jgi:hypothetical protein
LDHVLHYGIGKQIVLYFYDKLTPNEQAIFEARFNSFIGPRGYQKYTFNFTATIGSNFSMAHYRRAWPLIVVVGDQLGDQSVFACLIEFFSLVTSILDLDQSYSEQAITNLKTKTMALIRKITPFIGDRQNVHNLEELVYRDLPTWYK